jgi:hypothetical protein
MSRQIGTAMGVALLGSVFLGHVDAELPRRLAGLPAADIARASSAAQHFLPAGSGATRLAAQQVIVDGFVRVTMVVSLVSAGAAIAASFIRHRLETKEPVLLVQSVPESGMSQSPAPSAVPVDAAV